LREHAHERTDNAAARARAIRRAGILAAPMSADLPSFELAVEADDGRTTFIPRGELDLATAPELEAQVLGKLRAADGTVVLDLRELTFMDSTGVRTLVAAHQAAGESGAELVILRPDPETPVARVIEISGIDDALGLVDGE
jgi:anti-anti-sigma factor